MLDHLRDIIAENDRLWTDNQIEEVNNLNWNRFQDFTYANVLEQVSENLPSYCPFDTCCNKDKNQKKSKNEKEKVSKRKSTQDEKKYDLKNDISRIMKTNKDRRKSFPQMFKNNQNNICTK